MSRLALSSLIAATLLGLSTAAQAQQDYTPVKVAEMVRDSVVSIDANSIAFNAIYQGGLGELARQSRVLTNRITGFVYSADGYIITDGNNVTEDALITVTTADGKEHQGRVVDLDEDYGVAVIKIDADTKLTPVKIIADLYDEEQGSFPFAQGDEVIAIGYSGGYGGTVTAGIISAVRNMRNNSGILIPNMIQADAVINSGNEGCALFNNHGEVIGIHTRQASSGRGTLQRTTFFTPMWLVKRVADEMIANSKKPNPEADFKVWRPWLGIKPFAGSRNAFTGQIRQVGDDLKMYMDWPDQYWDVGIWLDQVWLESPAAEFGLKAKDVLYSVTIIKSDGKGQDETVVPYQYLKTVEQLETLITTAKPDYIFVFGVWRNNRVFDREVEIGQHPGAFSTGLGLNFQNGPENSRDYF
jgi:S1-C subfamily serine protease